MKMFACFLFVSIIIYQTNGAHILSLSAQNVSAVYNESTILKCAVQLNETSSFDRVVIRIQHVSGRQMLMNESSDTDYVSLEIASVDITDRGSYTCTARTESETVNTTFYLFVNGFNLQVTSKPVSLRKYVYDEASFSCTFSHVVDHVIWRKDTNRIDTGETKYSITRGAQTTFIINPVTLSDFGTYTCTGMYLEFIAQAEATLILQTGTDLTWYIIAIIVIIIISVIGLLAVCAYFMIANADICFGMDKKEIFQRVETQLRKIREMRKKVNTEYYSPYIITHSSDEESVKEEEDEMIHTTITEYTPHTQEINKKRLPPVSRYRYLNSPTDYNDETALMVAAEVNEPVESGDDNDDDNNLPHGMTSESLTIEMKHNPQDFSSDEEESTFDLEKIAPQNQDESELRPEMTAESVTIEMNYNPQDFSSDEEESTFDLEKIMAQHVASENEFWPWKSPLTVDPFSPKVDKEKDLDNLEKLIDSKSSKKDKDKSKARRKISSLFKRNKKVDKPQKKSSKKEKSPRKAANNKNSTTIENQSESKPPIESKPIPVSHTEPEEPVAASFTKPDESNTSQESSDDEDGNYIPPGMIGESIAIEYNLPDFSSDEEEPTFDLQKIMAQHVIDDDESLSPTESEEQVAVSFTKADEPVAANISQGSSDDEDDSDYKPPEMTAESVTIEMNYNPQDFSSNEEESTYDLEKIMAQHVASENEFWPWKSPLTVDPFSPKVDKEKDLDNLEKLIDSKSSKKDKDKSKAKQKISSLFKRNKQVDKTQKKSAKKEKSPRKAVNKKNSTTKESQSESKPVTVSPIESKPIPVSPTEPEFQEEPVAASFPKPDEPVAANISQESSDDEDGDYKPPGMIGESVTIEYNLPDFSSDEEEPTFDLLKKMAQHVVDDNESLSPTESEEQVAVSSTKPDEPVAANISQESSDDEDVDHIPPELIGESVTIEYNLPDYSSDEEEPTFDLQKIKAQHVVDDNEFFSPTEPEEPPVVISFTKPEEPVAEPKEPQVSFTEPEEPVAVSFTEEPVAEPKEHQVSFTEPEEPVAVSFTEEPLFVSSNKLIKEPVSVSSTKQVVVSFTEPEEPVAVPSFTEEPVAVSSTKEVAVSFTEEPLFVSSNKLIKEPVSVSSTKQVVVSFTEPEEPVAVPSFTEESVAVSSTKEVAVSFTEEPVVVSSIRQVDHTEQPVAVFSTKEIVSSTKQTVSSQATKQVSVSSTKQVAVSFTGPEEPAAVSFIEEPVVSSTKQVAVSFAEEPVAISFTEKPVAVSSTKQVDVTYTEEPVAVFSTKQVISSTKQVISSQATKQVAVSSTEQVVSSQATKQVAVSSTKQSTEPLKTKSITLEKKQKSAMQHKPRKVKKQEEPKIINDNTVKQSDDGTLYMETVYIPPSVYSDDDDDDDDFFNDDDSLIDTSMFTPAKTPVQPFNTENDDDEVDQQRKESEMKKNFPSKEIKPVSNLNVATNSKFTSANKPVSGKTKEKVTPEKIPAENIEEKKSLRSSLSGSDKKATTEKAKQNDKKKKTKETKKKKSSKDESKKSQDFNSADIFY